MGVYSFLVCPFVHLSRFTCKSYEAVGPLAFILGRMIVQCSWSYYTAILIQQFLQELWDFNVFMQFNIIIICEQTPLSSLVRKLWYVIGQLVMMCSWSYYTAILIQQFMKGLSWPWSYGGWIHNYLCNQCLLPLMLWVRLPLRARSITLCDKVSQWLAAGQWFSPVSSTNKTNRHYIT
jgi:hypothetical protein